MTFSSLSIRNFLLHGVTSAVLPCSHCQLLIGQKCNHRDVSFSCFCSLQSDRVAPDSAGNQPAFGFVSLRKISFAFKGTQSQTPHASLWVISRALNPTTTIKPRSAQLGSALHIFWGVLSPRLWFCSSSFVLLLSRALAYHTVVLRAGTDVLGRKHNSSLPDLPGNHLPLLQM